MTAAWVSVDVATVWAHPTRPRDIDAPALADVPDHRAWLGSMDAATRYGLHGRTETQLLRGEPAEVLHRQGDWSQVVAPWQPSPLDARGYPGWVRSAHLHESGAGVAGSPTAAIGTEPAAVLGEARKFLGLRYLWGGTSPWGFDCSGLVHYCYRRGGRVVPRDASAQHDASTPVELGDERVGDLYFFARPGEEAFHVGFVTGRMRMLHAPEEDAMIEDAQLNPERRQTLVGAGRFASA